MTAPELALSKDPRASAAAADAERAPPLSIACRGLLVLFAVGLSVGFCIGFLLLKDPLGPYLTNNEMRPSIRRFVLNVAFGSGAVVTSWAFVAAIRLRRVTSPAETLQRVAYRAAPLGVTGFLPLLFHWEAFRGHDFEFLTLVALAAVVLEAGMRARLATEPTRPESFVGGKLRRIASDIAARLPTVAVRAPLLLVCGSALAYGVYFSYVTIAWHHAVRSGYDVAVQNNLLWNLIHGGPFFKSSPVTGPSGTIFGYGAPFFAYAIAPLYALHQRPETLYVVQATLLGGAAVPLYLYARLYLDRGPSCVLALAYLLFAGLHGATLYEFHYLPLSMPFAWLALYALESRRNALAAVAVVLALSTSEDVALTFVGLGLYLLVGAKRPRAGLVVALSSAAYFVTMKLWILPRFPGADVTSTYQRLLPAGEGGLGGLVQTIVTNPWYTLGTILEDEKLTFAMQLLVPLALLPLRRPITALLAMPALFLTTLSSSVPASSIHYQYSAHWITVLFVATVLVLAARTGTARRASLCALALSTLACSYQYGAVFQGHTSLCGPLPFKFGMDREGRARGQAIEAVIRTLPPRAKVSCSAFTTPQVSNRPDAYSLTIGVFDADYLLFPTSRTDFVGGEYGAVTQLLQSKAFGVVAVQPPFALAKKGQDPRRNAEVIAMMQ